MVCVIIGGNVPDSNLFSRHKANLVLAHEVIILSNNSPLQQAHGHNFQFLWTGHHLK